MSDDRPRPRYGEYAPGYVPPADAAAETRDPAPASDPAPAGPVAPGAGTSGAATPGWTTPDSTAPGSTAPGSTAPVPSAGPWVAAPAAPAPVRRRTGDTVVTVMLLVLGLIGMLVGILFGIALGDREVLNSAFERQGFGSFNGTPGAAPLVIIVSHVVLYLLAAVLAIRNIVRGRIAFWIPLVAGVVAAVVFWISYISVLASDPSLLHRLGG